jgi:bacillithiol biosynthesis cysteine-adding enzyme BshC
MPTDRTSYQDSGFFSRLIVDYLDRADSVKPLYNRFPELPAFGAQIKEKAANFKGDRNLLADVILEQYAALHPGKQTVSQIGKLRNTSTFTVTTGHQLNLFTGPLYFLYKIATAINLSWKLKAAYPENDFVPVYWMATEDHDFDEINYFNFKGRKFRWNRESSGPVGRLSTAGLAGFLDVFAPELGYGHNAAFLKDLFEKAYLQHTDLAAATRYLAHELFGAHGLVIIDADDARLKRQFIPCIKKELLERPAFDAVSETIASIRGYDIQVNPREINLFYMEDGLRERIVPEGDGFSVNGTALRFSGEEMSGSLEKHPERFSPNVIMRPLYQEAILPNLCYIGGGGEIAYWLELKSFFGRMEVAFPMLMVRNSAVLVTEKQMAKADKLQLTWADLFKKPEALANDKIQSFTSFDLDFSPQKKFLEAQFEALERMAEQTDKSFTGAVRAQKAKQLKGLENLEKRLLKAEKRRHAEALQRIADLQAELFPGGGLQERFANFSEFWLLAGPELIGKIMASLDPFDARFSVITVG